MQIFLLKYKYSKVSNFIWCGCFLWVLWPSKATIKCCFDLLSNVFWLHDEYSLYINLLHYDKTSIFGSVRSSRNVNVRSSDEKCSRAHNIHLSLSGQSQDSLRSLKVSLGSVSGQSQVTQGQSQVSLRSLKVSLRSVSGQSQALRSVLGSLRSLSGLSVLTSSDRRSLKYFVLLMNL